MKHAEIVQLSKDNYEYIKALNIIATNLIQNGEIISYVRVDKFHTQVTVKNGDVMYMLLMYGNGDPDCKQITWERG